MTRLTLPAFVLLFFVVPLQAQVVYVDADATGANNGTSWNDAFTTLQDALADAASGDQIWVAEGTYAPDEGGGQTNDDRTASFQLISGVEIYGGFAGMETEVNQRDWQTHVTTLSGNIDHNGQRFGNSYHVVTGTGTDATAVLDGFTITKGYADEFSFPHDRGAGMRTGNGSPTLTNLIFSDNQAGEGGGMHSAGSPTLTNVTFSGNQAGYAGGGMLNNGGAPTLTNVTFSGNLAFSRGGGMYNFNGGSPMLTNVTFSENTSGNNGGGIYNNTDSSPTLTNTIVWGNTADNEGNEIYNSNSGSVTLFYSLYGNEPGDVGVGGGVTCTDDTCLHDDPLFVDTEEGNLRLMEGSPAIDAGDPDTDPLIFPTDENGDPVDLLGNPRFFGEAIDMGPFEWNPNVADEAGPEEAAKTLGVPYPNPASASVSLSLRLAEAQRVTARVYDTLGRLVSTVHADSLAAGEEVRLEIDTAPLAAGAYVVRVEGKGFAETRRFAVIR